MTTLLLLAAVAAPSQCIGPYCPQPGGYYGSRGPIVGPWAGFQNVPFGAAVAPGANYYGSGVVGLTRGPTVSDSYNPYPFGTIPQREYGEPYPQFAGQYSGGQVSVNVGGLGETAGFGYPAPPAFPSGQRFAGYDDRGLPVWVGQPIFMDGGPSYYSYPGRYSYRQRVRYRYP